MDHQNVSVKFANGSTATHATMLGCMKAGRTIWVLGTEGELEGNADDGLLKIRKYDKKLRLIPNKAGFIRANTAATTNMAIKTDVSLNIEKTFSTAINLSDGLTGGAFANGYYHAYLYTDLFVNNTGIGYGIIDSPAYDYIAYHIFVNGKSVAEINAETDTTDWDWKGSFPHTNGGKYEVPIMLYVSNNDDASTAAKGTTKLEFKLHGNYVSMPLTEILP